MINVRGVCREMKQKSRSRKRNVKMERKNAWAAYDEAGLTRVDAFARAYCDYLDHGKTERECVSASVQAAQARGFADLEALVRDGAALKAGDRVYVNWMNKCFLLFVVGSHPLEEGMNILGAHIDSPRLDVKQNPLFEEGDLAYLDTHYYGGIKKYQWLAMPLALHGVIVRKDGTKVEVALGEEQSDPVFCISDLLPHLGKDQMSKSAAELIDGDALNLIVGSRPLGGEEKEPVKAGVLALLREAYGVEEEDFLSAELEIVPAGRAREMGFDRSMILAYGHDDRVCAYAELAAILQLDVPEKTAVCIFADKEEIGSEGVSGMQSEAFEHFMQTLCQMQSVALTDCFANSFCISADVTAAYDPNFSEVYERRNAAYVNYGVGLCKYTGSGGKGGASDASAEVVGRIRKLFNGNGVMWQMAELGKTDAGGGGTVAKYMAKRNIDTLDAGVPVLSMHAPYETVAKLDCYMTYKGMKVFFEQN